MARRIVLLGEDEAPIRYPDSEGLLHRRAERRLPRAELAATFWPGPQANRRTSGSARLFRQSGTDATCAANLRAADAGKQVVLMGWVNRRRDHGNLIFLDLRDRTGIAQVVLDHDLTPEGHAKGEQVRPEYVVAAVGKVRLRDKDAINPEDADGRDRD